MGIRFLCPNGHKLNVKAFLAGKKGVCPQCGARMRIPQQSDPALRKPGEVADDADGPEQESEPILIGSETAAQQAVIKAAAVAATPVTPAQLATVDVVPRGVAVTAATAEPRDPFADAPNAVWYVRPPTGGQYGPARNDVMKRWVSEGRVTADSYVWREGWPDWKVASTALPGFRPATGTGSLGLDRGEVVAVSGQGGADAGRLGEFGGLATRAGVRGMSASPGVSPAGDSAAAARVLAARRKSNTGAIVAMVVLSLMAIALTVALFVVLRSN